MIKKHNGKVNKQYIVFEIIRQDILYIESMNRKLSVIIREYCKNNTHMALTSH